MAKVHLQSITFLFSRLLTSSHVLFLCRDEIFFIYGFLPFFTEVRGGQKNRALVKTEPNRTVRTSFNFKK